MSEKEIAFIICTNNAMYYNECVRYIQELDVPEGYSTDIICIQEAESMAQGYNAGMNASDAKYKVYLHQDTFILNRNFIRDIVRIFQSDETVGMIGMFGTDKLPADADCYLSWNIGKIDGYDGRKMMDSEFLQQSIEGKSVPAAAIDGCIMVTQYDVPWREDFLDGWDFYDISQSLEMQKRGYQVVIPYQDTAWCYHDCGTPKLKKYDFYRERMLCEYPTVFKGEIDWETAEKRQKEIAELEDIRKGLIYLMEVGAYEKLVEITQEFRERWLLDTQIREIVNMMEIYELEEDNIQGVHSEWFGLRNWEEIYKYYKWVCFVLRRLEWNREDERIESLKEMTANGQISRDAIRKISAITLKKTTKVYQYLLKEEKEEPLVSIVIAVYNGEKSIADTLDSVLEQAYANMEVIVVDDASTDRSKEIISCYAQKDSRIKLIFQEKNHHVCYTVNAAFREAKGKYIACIGHDDLWETDKLEKQVSFMEEHPSYGVCFTWTDMIDEEGKIVNIDNSDNYELYRRFCADNLSVQQWSRRLWLDGNGLCAPSVCIRHEVMKKVGYYRYALIQLQDYDLWLRMLRAGKIYMLQEKLTFCRRFQEAGKNLSNVNEKIQNRDWHEKQWIQCQYLESLTKEEFIQIFKKDMRNPDAQSEKEIACEKAFLLWKKGNCFSEKHFIELLEDEECRDILERNYQFTLNDFYRMNTEPMYFDQSFMKVIRDQQSRIKEYQQQRTEL